MVEETFYWHDYETFGRDPARDRAAQFAGVRTDADLNIIGDPLVLYCTPPKDYLPEPEACLLTGITPQQALAKGVCEARFIDQIQREFMQAPTCVVGYNNIRFDDEFTRHLLYRNFFDPYAREWRGGNTRWDLLDVIRMTRALRPKGIEWPVNDQGVAVNTLERLSQANDLQHDQAHDALSDVYATIALAQLLRRLKPKLYQYSLRLRDKRFAAKLLNFHQREMIVHTSGMVPSKFLNTSVFLPLFAHPSNKNGVVAYDLRVDPEPFFALDADALTQRLYTPAAELAEGEARLPLKVIHLNKCPMVSPISTLNSAASDRLEIDLALCEQHREKILANSEWLERCTSLYQPYEPTSESDPDALLYSGGFFSDSTRRWMSEIPTMRASELGKLTPPVDDKRLPEMLFRYRGRNFPESFSLTERVQWREHCSLWFEQDVGGESRIARYLNSLNDIVPEGEAQAKIVEQLKNYAQSLSGVNR